METADVVVIGAGANGTSTAFHLAKAGVKRVVVVERQVQRLTAVDNSDISPTRLTALETRLILASQGVLPSLHFKQRG
jgi:glycine/D-amino acid oxidase-like deaminating enzyme